MDQSEIVKRWNAGDNRLSIDDIFLAEESLFKKKLIKLPILNCDFCRIANKQFVTIRTDGVCRVGVEGLMYEYPHCGSQYQVEKKE